MLFTTRFQNRNSDSNVIARRESASAHGLTIEYGPDGKPARFTGGSDPRGEGLAKGGQQEGHSDDGKTSTTQ